jgi:hypothetical protein
VLPGIGVVAAVIVISIHGVVVVVRGRRRGGIVIIVVDGGLGWFDANHNHVIIFQSENEIPYKVVRLYDFSFFNLSPVLPHTAILYAC